MFLPLLTHQSHPSESHYFPLAPTFSRRILLHSHSAAPYIASDHPTGHVLTIHSSGECAVNEVELSVDWWATIGRWGTRYGTAAACWAVGIVAILMWDTWRLVEGGGEHSLARFTSFRGAHMSRKPQFQMLDPPWISSHARGYHTSFWHLTSSLYCHCG